MRGAPAILLLAGALIAAPALRAQERGMAPPQDPLEEGLRTVRPLTRALGALFPDLARQYRPEAIRAGVGQRGLGAIMAPIRREADQLEERYRSRQRLVLDPLLLALSAILPAGGRRGGWEVRAERGTLGLPVVAVSSQPCPGLPLRASMEVALGAIDLTGEEPWPVRGTIILGPATLAADWMRKSVTLGGALGMGPVSLAPSARLLWGGGGTRPGIGVRGRVGGGDLRGSLDWSPRAGGGIATAFLMRFQRTF